MLLYNGNSDTPKCKNQTQIIRLSTFTEVKYKYTCFRFDKVKSIIYLLHAALQFNSNNITFNILV